MRKRLNDDISPIQSVFPLGYNVRNVEMSCMGPLPYRSIKGEISERFVVVDAGLVRAYALARDPYAQWWFDVSRRER